MVWGEEGGGSRAAQSRNGSGGERKETEKGGVSGRRQKEEEAPSPSLSFAHIAKRATQKSPLEFFPYHEHGGKE